MHTVKWRTKQSVSSLLCSREGQGGLNTQGCVYVGSQLTFWRLNCCLLKPFSGSPWLCVRNLNSAWPAKVIFNECCIPSPASFLLSFPAPCLLLLHSIPVLLEVRILSTDAFSRKPGICVSTHPVSWVPTLSGLPTLSPKPRVFQVRVKLDLLASWGKRMAPLLLKAYYPFSVLLDHYCLCIINLQGCMNMFLILWGNNPSVPLRERELQA